MINKKLNSLLVIVILLLLNACQKDDITKNATIKGNVRNNCTGKGFANIAVEFITKQEKTFGKNVESTSIATTDASGNFIFSGIDIHSSSKYSYELSIATISYYGYYFYGIGPIEIDKDKLTNFQQFGVSASFKSCKLQMPAGVTVVSPDTFTLILTQPILHYYEPIRIYQLILPPRAFPSPPYNYCSFFNYPMGLWHITLDKTKSGVHSIVNDSIYLDMGATANYTVPW